MRRLALALAAGGIAVIGLAAPAQADPGEKYTYGHCVADWGVRPSNGLGPVNPHNPDSGLNPQGKPTGALRGNGHFDGGIVCPKA